MGEQVLYDSVTPSPGGAHRVQLGRRKDSPEAPCRSHSFAQYALVRLADDTDPYERTFVSARWPATDSRS